MLRRAWKPAVAVSVPALALLYYKTRQETFDLPVRVRAPDGKPEMSIRTLPLLTAAAVDARINEHATAHTVHRPGIVWKHTTATLAANDPLEDANAHQLIQRDSSDPAAPGDLLFFTIMDGHGGHHTSQASIHHNTGASAAVPAPADADPARAAAAIQGAFTRLDAELLAAPVRILAAALDPKATAADIPDLSSHPLALPSMLPAISGSCALMAVLDTAHRNLYVACTGDSRAVAGIWEPTPDGGRWRVDVLSEDQTGRNPAEAQRIRAEHPASEAQDVIRNGRILGGLEPARAFGDARYKWSRALQDTLARAFLAGTDRVMRAPSPAFKTPPYVTATPVVTHRVLDVPAPGAGARRFIVLATDGLWDELSSEDVVRLVGGHLAGLHGAVPKSALPELVPTAPPPAAAAEGKGRRRGDSTDGAWAFVDATPSAHLIRNAFGGADGPALRRLLSIPAPLARRYRDDVSVTVVWWEGTDADAQPAVTSVSLGELRAKAKL
ncbi:phosphatase 2C-like domain-containing protein [Mycena sp. CBHHK59/15]|nr:phosphatase 2C-like domain-containing protein [Mycena sp. CBHHK59/15]